MKAAGALVFAGGLVEEIDLAFGANDAGEITGPITKDGEFIGGLTIIDVKSDEEAQHWGAEIGKACGWPQEIRRFKGN